MSFNVPLESLTDYLLIHDSVSHCKRFNLHPPIINIIHSPSLKVPDFITNKAKRTKNRLLDLSLFIKTNKTIEIINLV